MSGIASGITGLLGLFGAGPGGSPPTITNPFQAVPLPTAGGAFGDLSSIGLDPEEQALVDFLGGEQDTRTRDIYARLGLGGSTMEAQDLGANELARLAESANLIQANRGQAIQEQSVSGNQALQEQQTATNAALATQRNQLAAQSAAFTQGQTSLTNLVRGLSGIGGGGGGAAAGTVPAAAPA